MMFDEMHSLRGGLNSSHLNIFYLSQRCQVNKGMSTFSF